MVGKTRDGPKSVFHSVILALSFHIASSHYLCVSSWLNMDLRYHMCFKNMLPEMNEKMWFPAASLSYI